MGFLHQGEAPAPEAAVAARLPALSDAAVSETVALAGAYAHLRGAFLALSGVSLLRNLGVAVPGELGGVIANARAQLSDARSALRMAAASAHGWVGDRASLLRNGIDVLDAQAVTVARHGVGDVDAAALSLVRGILARTAVADAGMRYYASVSCAGYPGARPPVPPHRDGGHGGHGIHHHHHQHDHPDHDHE